MCVFNKCQTFITCGRFSETLKMQILGKMILSQFLLCGMKMSTEKYYLKMNRCKIHIYIIVLFLFLTSLWIALQKGSWPIEGRKCKFGQLQHSKSLCLKILREKEQSGVLLIDKLGFLKMMLFSLRFCDLKGRKWCCMFLF